MSYKIQIGGGACSLCGSPGTNKTSCPLNPLAVRPNLGKHSGAEAIIKSRFGKVTAPVQAPAPVPIQLQLQLRQPKQKPAPKRRVLPVRPIRIRKVQVKPVQTVHKLLPVPNEPSINYNGKFLVPAYVQRSH